MLTTYSMEIVPYTLRSKAALLNGLAVHGWVFFNNYVNNLGMDAISWRYYIVFCVLLFSHAVVVYFFFPETYGLQLEEVAQVFGENINDVRTAADKAVMDETIDDGTEYINRSLSSITHRV